MLQKDKVYSNFAELKGPGSESCRDFLADYENDEMMPQDTAWYRNHAGSSEKGNKVKEKVFRQVS